MLPRNPEFIVTSEPPEPLYVPKETILMDSLKREAERYIYPDSMINRLIYESMDPSPFTKDLDPAAYGLDRLPFYLPESKEDTTLVFESRFESGNLRRVIQLSDFEYNLILKTDYNTNCHTQWYYFSVANVRKDIPYRFDIINLNKPDSLYNEGMKILCYSEKKARLKKVGWYRSGQEICYFCNSLKKKNGTFFYSLTFQMKFDYDYDTVYMAHCYPYTYTQLQRFLRSLEADPHKKSRYQRKLLCQTIAGNNCDYVIIGDFNNGKEKKGIFLTSRVHPGESMSSYLIEYLIEFLVSNNPTARLLRENFIFKIVPMLNIDGVINGNYRCNLAAVDLNRQWLEPSKKYHPTIYHTKQLIRKSKEERELLIYCDFHGHSRKKNIFIYGCSGKDPARKEMLFPLLMRNNSSVFSFKDCSFAIQKDREGAARIALWKDLNIMNCYTLELSFCGADFGEREYLHFNLDQFKEIAQGFCQSILELYDPDQVKVRQVSEELERLLLKNDRVDEDKKSDGDDSDFSNEDPKETGLPVPDKVEGKASSTGIEFGGRNLQIKKKPPNFPLKKKK
jgi:hypothetical protein